MERIPTGHRSNPDPNAEVMVEYVLRDWQDEYWIDVYTDRVLFSRIGPFESLEERQSAYDELLSTIRSLGGRDIPTAMQ